MLFGITRFCSYEPSAGHQSQPSTLSIASPIPTIRSLDFQYKPVVRGEQQIIIFLRFLIA